MPSIPLTIANSFLTCMHKSMVHFDYILRAIIAEARTVESRKRGKPTDQLNTTGQVGIYAVHPMNSLIKVSVENVLVGDCQ